METTKKYFLDILNKQINNNKFIDNQIYKLYSNLSYNHIIWILFHSFSVNLDENLLQNLTFKNNLIYLINNFYILKFKCIKNCGNSYKEFISNYNLSTDKIIESKYNLIIFFMDYHNYVSKKINKSDDDNKYIYCYDEVIKLYTNNDFIVYFNEKFDVNITNILLEENISLINLIKKIDEKIKKIYSDELITEICLKYK